MFNTIPMQISLVFNWNSYILNKNVWRPKLDSYIAFWAETSSKSIAPVLRIWWRGYFRAKPASKVSFWWIWGWIRIFPGCCLNKAVNRMEPKQSKNQWRHISRELRCRPSPRHWVRGLWMRVFYWFCIVFGSILIEIWPESEQLTRRND